VKSLQDSLSVFSVELIPIHERLVTLRRQLVALAAKEGSHKAELKPLIEELRKIDSLSLLRRVFRVLSLQHGHADEYFDLLQKTRRREVSWTRRDRSNLSGDLFINVGRVL
jgi:hypothetical protein